MGIVCQLPTDVTIDDRISLVDLAARDGIIHHSRDRLPRTNDLITYSPAGIAPSDHPLRSLFLGRSLRDFNRYVARFARLDPEKTGTLTNRTLRQYVDRKENTDVDWTEDDSTGCWLLPQIYAKWCRVKVETQSAPNHGLARTPPTAVVTDVDASTLSNGETPHSEPPVTTSSPSRWQLVWNFLIDGPKVTGLAFFLMAGCALLLFSRGRRMGRVTQGVTVPARLVPKVAGCPPPSEAGTVRLPDPRHPIVRPLVNNRPDDDLTRLFGGRPTGRIEVGIREGAAPRTPVDPGGVGRDATVVRRLTEAAPGEDPARTVTVEFLGREETLTLDRLKQYLRLRRTTVSRLLENHQYNTNYEEARAVYAEMVALLRAWHNGPRGYSAIPILPGGRLTLDQEARSLLRLHGGLDLQGESFMITEVTEGVGRVTMRQIRITAENLIHAVEVEKDPTLRFKIYPLLESIYLTPYSLI